VTTIDPQAVRRALGLYRTWAIVAGVAVFVLIVEMLLKYGLHQSNVFTANWGYIHGFLYMIFAATVANLGFKAQWPLLRIVLNMLSGFVPFLTFVAEKRVSADVEQQIAGGA
jgi:integral membrane protein